MKQKITLKHIARELDVSISTVSKALRNSKEISQDTREKIQAFARHYNYKPNNVALSLKSRKTKIIGVIIPEIVHHFFTTVIRGIEEVANEKGYHVIICVSNNSFEKEVINMDLLANGSTDGFIISVAKETQQKQDYNHLKDMIKQGMPLVMFDRIIDELQCDKVIIDDVRSAQKAVQKLINLGCKNIGLITTVDYVSVGKLRTRGYLNAHEESNIQVKKDLILKVEDFETSEEAIENFLKTREVDGIFAVNEHFAIYAIKALHKKGRKIPQDVLVIGFTDGELSKQFIPSLTTVSQHGEEMGACAAKMLIRKLENPEQFGETKETIIIETSLVERDSTKNHILH